MTKMDWKPVLCPCKNPLMSPNFIFKTSMIFIQALTSPNSSSKVVYDTFHFSIKNFSKVDRWQNITLTFLRSIKFFSATEVSLSGPRPMPFDSVWAAESESVVKNMNIESPIFAGVSGNRSLPCKNPLMGPNLIFKTSTYSPASHESNSSSKVVYYAFIFYKLIFTSR